eukprot:scaffold620_cov74-Skeletonema_dohrnii-CCMP3373.AAC.2
METASIFWREAIVVNESRKLQAARSLPRRRAPIGMPEGILVGTHTYLLGHYDTGIYISMGLPCELALFLNYYYPLSVVVVEEKLGRNHCIGLARQEAQRSQAHRLSRLM